ncbi:NAD(P)/FAD-dependent oxidoreductase [Marinivivus vitaminiproducens]|uniref:NAD(P)/FAD-dependent oxidoreductase n=1 Tax=Marinivivus vitaminiproducens TaxID=3035935 RepID=UPI00279CFE7B|nr:NAD(P)/FAD-dependent oxidoreductase [Geminicoccaceae bacterium SCSIO 64248]
MLYDVIIVGASYAGLSAGLQLARARRRVLLIDAGQRRNAEAAAAHGFLSRDGEAPGEIVRVARDQLLAYPTVEMIDGEALDAAANSGAFDVTLDSGPSVSARRLVLATGVGDVLPEVPGMARKWGDSVVLCPYCHAYEFSNQPLGVIATHAVSQHQAVLLPDWGPTTYFTQGVFEPDEEHGALLHARGVAIERTPVVELLGPSSKLEAVRLADGRKVPLSLALVATETRPIGRLAQQLGCVLVDGTTGPHIRTDEWQQTSVPGVFAAGDVAGPFHVITLAAMSGTMAGVGAHMSLVAESQPDARYHAERSRSVG